MCLQGREIPPERSNRSESKRLRSQREQQRPWPQRSHHTFFLLPPFIFWLILRQQSTFVSSCDLEYVKGHSAVFHTAGRQQRLSVRLCRVQTESLLQAAECWCVS